MSNQGMFPEAHFVDSNGIRLAVYEQGQGPAVILLHGFPRTRVFMAPSAAGVG